MGLHTNLFHIDPEFTKVVRKQIRKVAELTKTSATNGCTSTNPEISILYNAFTLDLRPSKIEALGKLGADSVYADSGGLQIVTAGRSADEPGIKEKIYKNQCYSDYAMCFDEIALGRLSESRSSSERANVSNKIFYNDKHIEAGEKTGKNIKQQCEYFKKHEAKTKAIIIVQGNSADDMVRFYNEIEKQLSESDYENIGGLAIADTCMGNKPLETIEMVEAAHRITRNCHENVKKHLHILGVGSLSRIKPFIYLLKSGYIDVFDKISYDSSTHTSGCNMGTLRVDGSTIKLGKYKSHSSVLEYKKIYDMFEPILKDVTSFDKFIDYIYDPETLTDKTAAMRKRAYNLDFPERAVVATIPMMFVYYMIDNFVRNVDKIYRNAEKETDIMRTLHDIKNQNDMVYWKQNFSKYVQSNRIQNQEEFSNLEALF